MKLDQFSVVLLTLRPDAPQMDVTEASTLQDAHLAHLADLHDAGHVVAAGPLLGNGTIRGLNIMTVDPDSARSLMAADPAVRAGRLAVTVLPWMVPEGAMTFARSRFPRSTAEVEASSTEL